MSQRSLFSQGSADVGQSTTLSQFFSGVAAKHLSAVEADKAVSNQHELDGVSALKELFGDEELSKASATYMYFTDDEEACITVEAWMTWYDSRLNQPHRSAEFRLYYAGTSVSDAMTTGDLVLIARTPGRATLFIVVQSGSVVESQIRWLFGLPEEFERGFVIRNLADDDIRLGVGASLVLEALGIEVGHGRPDLLEEMLKRFGGTFPTTKVFSAFARDTADGSSPVDDPDAALLNWWSHEEALFRTLETWIIREKLKDHFSDVDEFINFSLSVHGRRKSRAGYALENHVEQILIDNKIGYSRGKHTEGKSKPDFLFPSVEDYQSPDFPAARLTMLGSKSTLKERWRQVLTEAARIDEKHLLTLSPGISADQTEEMKTANLQLVVPTEIQQTYLPDQREWLMNFSDFLGVIRSRERT